MRAPSPWGDNRCVRVGLLGGSFNPAHDGHRHVAELALRRLGLDQVWAMVSPQNPLKDTAGMAPQALRLASAKVVMERHPRLLATAIESSLRTRFTADTLMRLRLRFPRVRFVWVMGADNLAQMHRWKRWRHIFSAVPIAILARAPYSRQALAAPAAQAMGHFRRPAGEARALATMTAPAWVFMHTPLHPASATEIRARMKRLEKERHDSTPT